MSKKIAATIPVKVLSVDWAHEVRFDPRVAKVSHTETRLRVAPVTMDFSKAQLEETPAQRPTEPATGRTLTGNTEFFLREVIPPADAA